MPKTKKSSHSFVGVRLGAHESIAGGVWKALERGAEHGCEAVQIFTKSARGWAAKPLAAQDAQTYREKAAATGLASAAHASYLVNLAAEPGDHRQKSLAAMADDWSRANALGLIGLVVHPGAHVDVARGTELVADAIAELDALVKPGAALLLLENTAGQGTSLGHRLDGLAAMLDATSKRGKFAKHRVGVCLDTCHLFAAGYDLSSENGYAAVMTEVDDRIGVERVRAFHLNDSKGPCGNRVDRHENIGEGHMGVAGFRALVNDARFDAVPAFLETEEGEQVKNLATLRGLRA